MLTFILILVGIILLVSPLLIMVINKEEKKINLSLKKKILLPILGVFFLTANGSMFYAGPGEYYLVQYIWGTQTAVMTPGPHFKFWGDTIGFKKVLTILQTDKEKTKASKRTKSMKIRFNDSVTADLSFALRFQMPSDPVKFKRLAIEYRSQENLINSSLLPMSRQVARNSARLISAQEWIDGKGGDFEIALRDQMENGQYTLNTIEIVDKKKSKIVKTQKQRDIDNEKVVKYKIEIVKDTNGMPKRMPLITEQYGIILADMNIIDIDLDDTFDKRLEEQRKAAAEGNIAKQQATKAEYDKQRIIAEGEKNKAEEKAKQEKEQVTVLIKAETEMKKAEISRQRAEIELRSAKLDAQKTKALADAEAYKRKAIMKADNSLSLRLKAYVEVNKNYANALKGAKLVPDTVIGGSGNSSANDYLSLLAAKAAKDLGIKK